MPKPATSLPKKIIFTGKYCRLEPLSESTHGESLWINAGTAENIWDYLMDGPWHNEQEFRHWLKLCENNQNRHYYSVIDQTSNVALGALCLLDCNLPYATCEIGGVFFSPKLQRTRIASEAVFLLIQQTFENIHFRRLQWKCNSENAASKKAAKRFGFIEEGTFLQHMIIKGKNRDTTFFSMLDKDWPSCKSAFEKWLDENNFDADGQQKKRLEEFRD